MLVRVRRHADVGVTYQDDAGNDVEVGRFAVRISTRGRSSQPFTARDERFLFKI